jgi:hypothetical protein
MMIKKVLRIICKDKDQIDGSHLDERIISQWPEIEGGIQGKEGITSDMV